jgi:hypothetical protein
MRPPARRPRHGRGRRETALPVVRVQQVPGAQAMTERTGYRIGMLTGERQDENPDGHCEASYDLIAPDGPTSPGDWGYISCDRVPGHEGECWDETSGVFFKTRIATREEYAAVMESRR